MTVSKAKHTGTETYFFPRSAGNNVVKYCTESASVCVSAVALRRMQKWYLFPLPLSADRAWLAACRPGSCRRGTLSLSAGRIRCRLKLGDSRRKRADSKRCPGGETHGDVDIFHFLQVGPASGHAGLHQQVLGAALLRRAAARVQIGVANVLQQGGLRGRHALQDLRDIGIRCCDSNSIQIHFIYHTRQANIQSDIINKVKTSVRCSLRLLNRQMEVGTKLREALFVLSGRDLYLMYSQVV